MYNSGNVCRWMNLNNMYGPGRIIGEYYPLHPAIWGEQSTPSTLPYGENSLPPPPCHMGRTVYPLHPAIWGEQSTPSTLPYGENSLPPPPCHMGLPPPPCHRGRTVYPLHPAIWEYYPLHPAIWGEQSIYPLHPAIWGEQSTPFTLP